MMKKIISLFVVLVIVIAIVTIFVSLGASKKTIVVKEGNIEQLPVEMQVGLYQDSDCKMVINNLIDASQVIIKSGKSWFFHDHGGMTKWLDDKEFRDSAKIWVMSRDTKR